MKVFSIHLKDLIVNNYLWVLSTIRYFLKITKKGPFKAPAAFNLVFSEMFKNSDLSNWHDSSLWWEQPYHPGNLNQWFDPEQSKITDNGIELSSVIKPRYFIKADYTIPNAISMLRTKESWKYGIFKFYAKLPKGTYLWPALWLTGENSWPPEIDVLEAYSKETTNYRNNKILQSNVHYKSEYGNKHIKGMNHWLPNKVTDEFIEYAVWWDKDFIKIYYNGYLVRHVTDKDVINKMNTNQHVVINSATSVGFFEDNETPLVVSLVEVYQ